MKKRPLCAICVLFLAIQSIRVLFFSVGETESSALEKLLSGEVQIEFTGTVYKIEEKQKVTAFYLKDNAVSAAGQIINESKILIYVSQNDTGQSAAVKTGNRLAVSGEAQVFDSARNPGNFDQKTYYRRQGIHVLVWAESISILSHDTDFVRQFLSDFRSAWNELFITRLGEYYGGTMSAILLGEKSGLDAEMKVMYQKCGISHLLAISGLHMTFIGMGIYHILRRTGFSFLSAGIAGGTILILYSLMIGAGVSSLRALIMFLVRIGAEITGRDYDLLTSLFLSAAILCAWQPLYLTDAGFQLSYGAILGIALLGPVFGDMFGCGQIAGIQKKLAQKKSSRMMRIKGKGMSVLLWILNGLSTSFAVNVLLLGPLLWFYFEIPPYSVFLNLIVIPVMPAAMGAGLAGSALTLVSDTVGDIVLQVCRAVLWGYDQVCEYACILPCSRLVAGKPGLLWIIVYYLILAGIFLSYQYFKGRKEQEEEKDEAISGRMPDFNAGSNGGRWKKLCRVPGCVMLLFAAGMTIGCRNCHQAGNEMQVTVLDVGQGDGIHVRASSLNCLIDGGSSDVSSVGVYRLEPYFLSQGIDTLDYVFVTHGDEDHVSGIQEMLENQLFGIRITSLVLPPQEYHDEKLTGLARTASRDGTRILVMQPGDEITSDGNGEKLVLACIGPGGDLGAEPGNETSLVLDLSYGDFDMLFTGDVEGEGEQNLIDSGVLKEYDVLKAAHHGSKNSGTEEFLGLTKPSYAVISAGVDNRYGHPHAETIRRLQEAGCRVCSTQDNGAITIRTDGKTMKIYGFIKKG